MSEVLQNHGFSGYTFPFETPAEAGLTETNNLFKSELASELEQRQIARIALAGIDENDFIRLRDAFHACLDACPELLPSTFHSVDRRYGNEAGYVRKERKIDPATGRQKDDPKHYFHFNEQANERWDEEFRITASELRGFLEIGADLHASLRSIGKTAIGQLEETHPGISNAYFPAGSDSVSFFRWVDYDDYTMTEDMVDLPVAKPHRDISGYTIQAWSSAPGFWGYTDEGKQYFDSEKGVGYLFAGATHAKLYGPDSFIRPLRHGVDRIVAEGAVQVPRRQAAILFMDPWKIDAGVTSADTLG